MGSVKSASKSSSLSSLLGASGSLSDLSGIGELAGGSSSKELALYENILLSRRNIEETIIKFNLNTEWDFKYLEDAVKFFKDEILVINKDRIAGTMEIGIYDIDQKRAKDIADFMIYQLNKLFTEMNVQNAKSYREFIESRYELLKKDLKKSEDTLKNFQDKYGIAPDLTLKAVTQSQVQIEAEIKSEEIKLDLLHKILTPNESEVKLQEEKIAMLKKQLVDIVTTEVNPQERLSLGKGSEVLMSYMRLQKEVEIQNKIQAFLLPMYEQAKLEEKKETPTVVVMDTPNFPEKKAKPKRIKTIAISLFIAFVIGSGCVMVYDRYKNIDFKSMFADTEDSVD
ncbi:MAG: hypothetical protein LWX07_09675 [Bacteroidetes bacterium]|nr:hypothetical protein [Bacteroidota bacterium]